MRLATAAGASRISVAQLHTVAHFHQFVCRERAFLETSQRSRARRRIRYVTAAGVDIVDSIFEWVVGEPLGEHVHEQIGTPQIDSSLCKQQT
jgi:hypothetical protein